ncbi:dynamin family protein [Cereibacter sphaeroides]|uniref:dynamin family protein n=1 Tax=Cereibacter sphaeroides TaxID=1063 RepID=UPI001F18C4A3|nr:dynamin family protein [Cereibacter sphaeroides]MCE6951386.1 dynamin family protein [Cereibacter sphaeroides]
MQIGSLQRKEIAALRSVVEAIETAAGRESREPFSRIRACLDAWTARVAVIGQVKAGKSSFLNAFIGQIGLLPSDVNPWTSVVTNLRINVPSDPPEGASFRFFDESSWDEIVNGDPRVRRLAEEMLPGFDTGILLRQAQEMRERAKRRLGRAYASLLGTTHDYDFLSPELLQSYVCAGPGADEGLDAQALGRYASITREADVYLRLPEFSVPVVLTDTPGVNDPFLVRDEFTCRSLDRSDIFIVILSAHQPLTEADIALMRMLSAERAKNVIVFINRIDELEDLDTEIDALVADVAARLRAAIPHAAFSIHAGSAWLAELAQRDDPAARAIRDDLDSEMLPRFLASRYGEVPASQSDRLMLASGIAEVKQTLGSLIDLGAGYRQLAAIHEDLRSEVGALISLCKRERDSVAQQVESVSGRSASRFLLEIRGELGQLSDLRRRLDQRFEAMASATDRLLARAGIALQQAMDATIRDFVEEQRAAVLARASGNDRRPMTVDLLTLSRKLDRDISDIYRRYRAAVDTALNDCLVAAASIAGERFEGIAEGVSLRELPNDEFMTALTLSRKALTVDVISARGWAFWRRPGMDAQKTFDALRRITLAELLPWSQKILKACNEAQAQRVLAGKERIQIILSMVDKAIEERAQRLRSDSAVLAQLAADPSRAAQMANRLQSRMEVLERRLQLLSVSDSHLSKSHLAAA